MSISGALSNALSGLTAATRASQVVSSNVANAMTEGYGTRELSLSARGLAGAGAGVQVDGVIRVVDQGLLQDRRLADGALGFASTEGEAARRLETIVGLPDDDGSLAGLIRNFESAILSAGSRPDSETRLANVLSAAVALSDGLNAASDNVQAERLAADRSIGTQVELLNASLLQVQDLNTQISALNGRGRDVTALEDERQRVIDRISEIVPVREVPRDDGRVSIYTEGGAILLDDTPRQITFSAVNFITPDMTLASGALSQLSIDGRPMATQGSFAPLGGGTLAASFVVRDESATVLQSRLDSVARDLVDRFADPMLDPTLDPTDAGLFTDRGAAFDPLDEIGLAGRLEVNVLADPAEGGALYRLRDGLGAASPGPAGDATLLYGYADALSAARVPATAAITNSPASGFDLVSELTSLTAASRVQAETREGFAAASQSSLKAIELASGVDTDQELQKLLLIEQAYAANARVVTTIDSMIQSLLAI